MLEQDPRFRNRIPLILCAHSKSFIICKHKCMYVPMKMLYLLTLSLFIRACKHKKHLFGPREGAGENI